MFPVTTQTTNNAGAYSQLNEYLQIHFADTDFAYSCPTTVATDLFRQYYIFMGTDVTKWYSDFQETFIKLAQLTGLSADEAEYLLRSGTFAYNVQQVKASFPVVSR